MEFRTDSVNEARLKLIQVYGSRRIDTPLFYDAQFGQIVGNQDGFDPELSSVELALLTVKRNGSAHEGYKSVSDKPEFQVPLHVEMVMH